MKSYHEIISESIVALAKIDQSKFEAESLLAFVLGRNRSHIIAFPEKIVAEEDYIRYLALLDQRAKGVPFAYLTGEKEFYDLTLKVTPATLIPRADTELLVETALSKMSINDVYHVIDMGTGTGAIALTIKNHRPNAAVIAVDQSAAALSVARENGANLQIDVDFLESNWFSNVPARIFDFILSNPPYIDPEDEHLVGDGVKYEPITALVADDSGYADLFYLIEHSLVHLNDGGWLMMEHGFEQGQVLQDKFIEFNYHNVVTLQDLSGNDRITIGQK